MKYLVERWLRDGAELARAGAEHRSYWQRMVRDRVLLYGGVWAEGQGDTLIVEVDGLAALRRVLSLDPYARRGVVLGVRTRRLGDAPDRSPGGPSGRPSPGDAEPGSTESGGGAPRAMRSVGARSGATASARGGVATLEAVVPAAPSAAEHERLSAHEARIARMMLDGMTNRQMASALGVSARAVEQHITRIYRKLAIARRAQLAVALHGLPAA
ncbi:helix-turn-helix transcriptional regulator [Streptomyces bohaiensis]|nr:helix-turn-helix transcriptional regulator [Streptomyces bohaiensis]